METGKPSPGSFETMVGARVIVRDETGYKVMPGAGEYPAGAEVYTAGVWARRTGIGVEAILHALRNGEVPTTD